VSLCVEGDDARMVPANGGMVEGKTWFLRIMSHLASTLTA